MNVRAAASAVLSFFSLCMLIWVYYPQRRLTATLVLRPVEVVSLKRPGSTRVLLELFPLEMDIPRVIRLGDEETLSLQLHLDEVTDWHSIGEDGEDHPEEEKIAFAEVFQEFNVVAEASLDLPGVQVTPPGVVSRPLKPREEISFRWGLSPGSDGTHRGTLWLYLDIVERGSGSTERVPVLARLVEIECVDLFGLTVHRVRWVSVAGLVLSLGLVLWFTYGTGRAAEECTSG